VRDVVLTPDEIDGLMAGLLVSSCNATLSPTRQSLTILTEQ
jgi:hypothetical protein